MFLQNEQYIYDLYEHMLLLPSGRQTVSFRFTSQGAVGDNAARGHGRYYYYDVLYFSSSGSYTLAQCDSLWWIYLIIYDKGSQIWAISSKCH